MSFEVGPKAATISGVYCFANTCKIANSKVTNDTFLHLFLIKSLFNKYVHEIKQYRQFQALLVTYSSQHFLTFL